VLDTPVTEDHMNRESDVFEIISGGNLVEPAEVRWSRWVAFA